MVPCGEFKIASGLSSAPWEAEPEEEAGPGVGMCVCELQAPGGEHEGRGSPALPLSWQPVVMPGRLLGTCVCPAPQLSRKRIGWGRVWGAPQATAWGGMCLLTTHLLLLTGHHLCPGELFTHSSGCLGSQSPGSNAMSSSRIQGRSLSTGAPTGRQGRETPAEGDGSGFTACCPSCLVFPVEHLT